MANDPARKPLYTQFNVSHDDYDPATYQPPKKKRRSKCLIIGLPLLLILIAGGVAGGIVASKKLNQGSSSTSSANAGGAGAGTGGQGTVDGAHSSILHQQGRFAIATDTNSFPVYPSTTDTAQYSTPTFVEVNNPAINWPQDPFQPTAPSLANLRPDRPRLIAGKHKIDALLSLKDGDPYLKGWHDTIMDDARRYKDMDPVIHKFDGGALGSGILDPAREVKLRIKLWVYAYRIDQARDTSWVDRVVRELEHAASWALESHEKDGDPADPWNSKHFLDTAELTMAYAVAYDWLHDVLTDDQKTTIRSNIIEYGLKMGIKGYQDNIFWTSVKGNWNCVSNAGMIMGCLAIQGEDDSRVCDTDGFLSKVVQNALDNCAHVPTESGSGPETPNYWYFAMTGLAELASSLQVATGSDLKTSGDLNVLGINDSLKQTSLYHMYITGMTRMFDHGDHGPNKFSTTANSLLYFGSAFNIPAYTLYQRDRVDAAEPWSMFWYDPAVSGAWWDELPLDKYFDDDATRWGSMRSSWTDNNGMYVAMKASKLIGHEKHGDLDAGDFVLDAMGERWAGELGSANYLYRDYFTSEAQDAARWRWYRKMTEGQNTLSIAGANQNVNGLAQVRWDSSNTKQGSSTLIDLPSDSTAFMTADLTTYYDHSIKRGIRFINGRRQVLLQDELTGVPQVTYWRMHTNATIAISGNVATLSQHGKSFQAVLVDPPSGVSWEKREPVRTDDAPGLQGQEADQENLGVSVLSLSIPAMTGTSTIQVLFNPQWDGFSSFVTPALVPLESWTLASHQGS